METKTNTHALEVVNAYDIYMKDLPPTKWYVGDILHEGACLLSGDPKVGKSYLALQIAVAVAGTTDRICGALPVGEHGRVLYLAVDDGSEKRIHDRLHQLNCRRRDGQEYRLRLPENSASAIEGSGCAPGRPAR
jgi:predicted ATP-dependent serine protease